MIPTLVPEPFHRPGWIYEEKVDGWRILAYKDGPRVRLLSRNRVDHARRFPELAAVIAGLLVPTLVAPTPWRAVQRAGWDAIQHAERFF